MSSYFNPAESLFNVVDFFDAVDKSKGGDGIVWAKATAPKGAQVIIELESAQGKRIKIPAIVPGDPVCLSRYAKWDDISRSSDLLQTAQNGSLKLMTQKEAHAFFEKKAKLLKTSASELIKQSDAKARAGLNARPLPDSQVDKSAKLNDQEYVAIEETVSPRIVNLCNSVRPQLKDDQRAPVNEVMSELLTLEDSMSLEDADYLRAQGYYPSVKKFANQKWNELAKSSGLIPTRDELSDDSAEE